MTIVENKFVIKIKLNLGPQEEQESLLTPDPSPAPALCHGGLFCVDACTHASLCFLGTHYTEVHIADMPFTSSSLSDSPRPSGIPPFPWITTVHCFLHFLLRWSY